MHQELIQPLREVLASLTLFLEVLEKQEAATPSKPDETTPPESDTPPAKGKPKATKEKPAKAPKSPPPPPPEEAPEPSPPPEETTMELKHIQAVVGEAFARGEDGKVRKFLKSRGAANLSKLDPSHWPDLVAELQ